MKQPIRIALADDHSIFREGMKVLLEKTNELEITGMAGNGKELLKIIREQKPDVVITDIDMPEMNGIEATREIHKEFPDIPVIALTIFNDEHFIVDMLEAGAKGYITKSTPKEEVLEAAKAVLAGEEYICNAATMRLTRMIANSKMTARKSKIEFSEKEIEIIQLICEQFASKEIADKTNLAFRTVEKYRHNIMEKIGARNLAGVVVYAIREGIWKV